ncbi:IST1 homolog [Phalaenopsis equestris]|uniref:IST1 homolog n=1 Tax=Phalaenopsis equestris TaxID=78828 RepID=UPI0009E6000A|nr:IST1 homolog [Phalaenopsis equestris]
MSGLNSLFNRATFGTRCKTCLNLAVSRIKLLHNRRELQLKNMRKEIAQFLQTGQEAIARIKVEHVIREQNISAAYEILELFCEFLIARIPVLEAQRNCPPELLEAVASIIFASPRCSDVPELLQVRNLLTAKYGKDFVSAAAELRPDSGVNRTVIEKLSVGAPPVDIRLKILKEISQEYNLDWDTSSTEKEFSKKHEDLLDGSIPLPPIKSPTDVSSPKIGKQESKELNNHASRTESPLSSPKNIVLKSSESETEANQRPLDAMERAQAALATAEHALAAARAAAELSKVKLFTPESPKHFH